MPLNQPNTLATFFFTGLSLFEFDEQANQCDIGIVSCQDHDLTLDIFEVPMNGGPSRKISHPLSLEHDIDIFLKPKAPVARTNDARKHLVPPPENDPTKDFNRAADWGDENDFRWVFSIENDLPDKQPLKRKVEMGAAVLSPKIRFSNGLFYTEKKEKSKFTIAQLDVPVNDRTYNLLGSIAFIIAADLTCPPEAGNRIVLQDTNGAIIELPWQQGIQYHVKIDNSCIRSSDSLVAGTDFLVYYDVLEAVAGQTKVCDLRRVIAHNGSPDGAKTLIDAADLVVDSGDQACDGVTKP